MSTRGVYLDFAAATPLSKDVKAAMEPFFSTHFHNPSAEYEPARMARKAVDNARSKVASIIGSKPLEIIFTSGGTEANNLAVHGIMRKYPGSNMVLSAIEHDSVLNPAQVYPHNLIGVNKQGIVKLDDIAQKISDDTVLVSVMYANNEVGTLQPIRKIAIEIERIRQNRLASGNKLPLYLHTDAAQAGNYLDLHVHRLGVDIMTLNGGKIYGPKQTGVLFVRGDVDLQPILHGGGQERGLRSGTENTPGVVGFSVALEQAQSIREQERQRLGDLQSYLASGLEQKIPRVVINGSTKQRLPNNIHFSIPKLDNERLQMLLDYAGIYLATGSACSASNDEPSHVLAAMKLDEEVARGSLRITMGRTTTRRDLDYFVTTLVKILATT